VGALNGAYFAAQPDGEGLKRLERIWSGLRRADIFPVSPFNSHRE
jgi:NTE family protein